MSDLCSLASDDCKIERVEKAGIFFHANFKSKLF